ncbi:hypothetical protein M3181_21975 [Mesobacillus maritimus]|uniref:hypothetical protein n=1 Tax=Mesobacillus maritimus TaxID=1643336 RepID=UPI0020418885|nr:hypothetical protein [Mesobacillus maritimus]MCM3671628.1 hypothetical protein [Mesobacillus maritimus]
MEPKFQDLIEIVTLAYKAVTLEEPTNEEVNLLAGQGPKRALEILLIMQQSPKKVRSRIGFIKSAIEKNWTPNTPPVKLPRKQAKRLYDLSQEVVGSTIQRDPNAFNEWLSD